MAEDLSEEPAIQIRNDVVLNQFVVRFGADKPAAVGDDLTLQTIRAVQEDGTCFVGGAKWRDEWVMRVSVINAGTTEADALRSAAAIRAAWHRIRAGNASA
jgi:glutamate/tyrosine decarboxylase-like PLP-dependent enzyme